MTSKQGLTDNKMWGGRFREKMSEIVDSFNASISFDRRLYSQDIAGSIAHCRMLAKQKIITEEEASQINGALKENKKQMDRPRGYSYCSGKSAY